MPKIRRRKPTTKVGKKRKVSKVMREHKRGTLRSSSGQKVTKRRGRPKTRNRGK